MSLYSSLLSSPVLAFNLEPQLHRYLHRRQASSLTSASRKGQERKVQANFVAHSCGRDQCYINLLGDCFHKTSHECQNLIHASLPDAPIVTPQQIPSPRPISRPTQRPTERPTQSPTPIPTTRPTQRPTQRPVTPRQTPRPIQSPTKKPTTMRPVTQSQIFEIPILVRLLNVEEDYIPSASDRTRYLSMVRWVLDRTLVDWEILRLEYVGDYVGERRRRLQSLLQRELGKHSNRRLYKTIYLPVLVTLRLNGKGDSSDIARIITFILQILRSNLKILLARFKSLNPYEFRNLQLIVEELNLANIAVSSGSGTTNINGNGQGTQSSNTITISTNTNTSVETTSTSSTSSDSDGVTPSWVWLIVAAVFTCICIVIFMCMSRKHWVKSRDDVTKMDGDEYLNHLAVLYCYGRQKAEAKDGNRRQHDKMHRRRRSEREGAGTRRSDKRSKYYIKPKRQSSDRRIRRSSDVGDGYISSADIDIITRLGLGDRRSSSSRLLLMDQERALVAQPHRPRPPRRASFCATTATKTANRPPRRASFNDAISATHKRRRSHDLLLLDYQGFTLEPEGLKIEDVKTAVASCQDPPEELSHRRKRRSSTLSLFDDELLTAF